MNFIQITSGQKLQMKKQRDNVSSLYVLDENGNKIPALCPWTKKRLKNIDGSVMYEVRVCKNSNLRNSDEEINLFNY